MVVSQLCNIIFSDSTQHSQLCVLEEKIGVDDISQKNGSTKKVAFGSKFTVSINNLDSCATSSTQNVVQDMIPNVLCHRRGGGLTSIIRCNKKKEAQEVKVHKKNGLNGLRMDYRNKSPEILEARLKTHTYYVFRNVVRPNAKLLGVSPVFNPWRK